MVASGQFVKCTPSALLENDLSFVYKKTYDRPRKVLLLLALKVALEAKISSDLAVADALWVQAQITKYRFFEMLQSCSRVLIRRHPHSSNASQTSLTWKMD